MKQTVWDKDPSRAPKNVRPFRWLNPWVRICDFFLAQVTHPEIDEILDLKSAGIPDVSKADLFQRFFDEQAQNLKFILKWRYIFTKALWAKLTAVFYLYNRALYYFLDHPMRVPPAMAQPFGQRIGEALSSTENQLLLYLLLGLWLTMGLQLTITAAAREYMGRWKSSIILYAFGVPLLLSFALCFLALHKNHLAPPSVMLESSIEPTATLAPIPVPVVSSPEE